LIFHISFMHMLLHKDGLIELNYEVATDTLTVSWPDMTTFTLSEIRFALTTIIDTLKHYDIKKLLIDTRANVVEITDEAYAELMLQFSRDLTTTRLQKVARLHAVNPAHEKRVARVTKSVNEAVNLSIDFNSFTDEFSALSWLRH